MSDAAPAPAAPPAQPAPAAPVEAPPAAPPAPAAPAPEPAKPPEATPKPEPEKPKSFDELLSNGGYAAEFQRRVKAAAEKAVKDAADAAAQEAERAKLDATQRLELERNEAKQAAEAAQARAAELESSMAFSDAFLAAGLQLAGPSALAMLRTQALAKRAEAAQAGVDMPMAQAIQAAVADAPFLVRPAAPAVEAAPPPPPSSAPPPQPRPPAGPTPAAPVDTSQMTREARMEYRRKTYGV